MKSLITYLVLFCGLLSCNPQREPTAKDPDGIITRLPYIWKSALSDQVLGGGLFHGYVIGGKGPGSGGLLCVGLRKSTDPSIPRESYLILKDIKTGENIWVWDDLFGKTLVNILHRSVAVHNDLLLLHDWGADYCINIQTGQTVWKKVRTFSAALEISTLDNLFYFTALARNSKDSALIKDSFYEGDFMTGEIRELTGPHYSREFSYEVVGRLAIGTMRSIYALRRNEEDLLVVPFLESGPKAEVNRNRALFGLYSLSNKQWIYDRIPISPADYGGGPGLMPVVVNEKVFLTSLTTASALELSTGKLLWATRVTPLNTGFSDMIVVGNKVILNSDNATLYCLDAQTGHILWTQKSSYISSDLYHQNGVVYYMITQTLNAVDIETGKLLLNMAAPDSREGKTKGEASWFYGFVTGVEGKDGQKGRIFATTNLNAYCFEALK
jgi:outer membrane protein assembly factor BamB